MFGVEQFPGWGADIFEGVFVTLILFVLWISFRHDTRQDQDV
jgi:hypothetical protein